MKRPIILSCGEVVADWLEEVGAGLAIDPGDEVALVEAIVALRDDPEARRRFGARGRAYTELHHNRQRQAEEYLELVLSKTKLAPLVSQGPIIAKDEEAC